MVWKLVAVVGRVTFGPTESFANMMGMSVSMRLNQAQEYLRKFPNRRVCLWQLKREIRQTESVCHVRWNPWRNQYLVWSGLSFILREAALCTCRRWFGRMRPCQGLNATLLNTSMEIPSVVTFGMPWELPVSCLGTISSWLQGKPGYLYWAATVENRYLETLSKTILFIRNYEDRNTWVLPLNSNWKGLPKIHWKFKFFYLGCSNKGALRCTEKIQLSPQGSQRCLAWADF